MATIQFPWQKIAASPVEAGVTKQITDMTVGSNGLIYGISQGRIYFNNGSNPNWALAASSPYYTDVHRLTSLSDGSWLGINASGQYVTKTSIGASWQGPFPVAPTMLAAAGCKDGSIMFVADAGVSTGTKYNATKVAIPNSGGMIHATQVSDGTVFGVGKDNLVYVWDSLYGQWQKVPESGPVIAIAELSPTKLVALNKDYELCLARLNPSTATPSPTDPNANKLRILGQSFIEADNKIKLSLTYQMQFSSTEVRLDIGYIVAVTVEIPADIATQLQVLARRIRRVLGEITPGGQNMRVITVELLISKDDLVHPIESNRVFNDYRTSLSVALEVTSTIQSGTATVVKPVSLATGPSSALVLNGNDTHIELNAPLPLGAEVTFEAWMRGEPRGAYLFYLTDDARRRQFSAHVPYADGNIYFDAAADEGNNYDRIVKSVDAYDPNVWNHWAFVRNSNTGRMAIYRNGDLFLEQMGAMRVMASCNRLMIGADGDGNWHHLGAVSEVRLWSKERTAAEIKASMNKVIAAPDNGLVLCWSLDGCQAGQPVVDKSGGSRHGTIRGAVETTTAPSSLVY